MSKKTAIALFITGALAASTASYADHNGIWGAGTANMPNDIHNTRIEDDAETFMDLVQYGDGADSVNRYDDDSDTTDTMGVAASGSISNSTMGGSSRTSTLRASSRNLTSVPSTRRR